MSTNPYEIAQALRERILSREIAPGERMHQIQLSEMLGVSRTPLREALSQLASQGLLVYEPNRGYAVREFSRVEIEAAFEVRARLEALACSLCARKGLADADVTELWKCVATGDGILAKGILDPSDLAPYRQMNVRFHDTIIGRSGNPFLMEFIHQCYNLPLVSDRVFVWEDYKVIARSHDDHRRIVGAIEARDAERADHLMREHVRYAGIVLLENLKQRDLN